MKERKLKTYKEELRSNELKDYFVNWDDISQKDVNKLIKKLETSSNESEMQKFFEENPIFLIQQLRGGHGRWVISKKRLGSEFIIDFLIGESHSFGYDWVAIELESPKAKMFNKNGDLNKALNHAIRQIQDWRSWLTRNQDYAERSIAQNGLGLININPNLEGLIIIGRESDIDNNTNDRRRQYVSTLNIKIHTYDWLVRIFQGRLDALSRNKKQE